MKEITVIRSHKADVHADMTVYIVHRRAPIDSDFDGALFQQAFSNRLVRVTVINRMDGYFDVDDAKRIAQVVFSKSSIGPSGGYASHDW